MALLSFGRRPVDNLVRRMAWQGEIEILILTRQNGKIFLMALLNFGWRAGDFLVRQMGWRGEPEARTVPRAA